MHALTQQKFQPGYVIMMYTLIITSIIKCTAAMASGIPPTKLDFDANYYLLLSD